MKPLLPPTEVLRRVTRVARFNGMAILGLSGAYALLSAASRDVSGSVIGLLVAAAGAIELHGSALLRAGRGNGMRWLVSSQFYLLATVLGYVAVRLANPDISVIRPVVTTELAEQIRQAGMTVDQFLVEFLRLFYFCVAGATLLYQGGMILYYVKRRSAVEAAMLETEVL
jgi:hypothetical protein